MLLLHLYCLFIFFVLHFLVLCDKTEKKFKQTQLFVQRLIDKTVIPSHVKPLRNIYYKRKTKNKTNSLSYLFPGVENILFNEIHQSYILPENYPPFAWGS